MTTDPKNQPTQTMTTDPKNQPTDTSKITPPVDPPAPTGEKPTGRSIAKSETIDVHRMSNGLTVQTHPAKVTRVGKPRNEGEEPVIDCQLLHNEDELVGVPPADGSSLTFDNNRRWPCYTRRGAGE